MREPIGMRPARKACVDQGCRFESREVHARAKFTGMHVMKFKDLRMEFKDTQIAGMLASKFERRFGVCERLQEVAIDQVNVFARSHDDSDRITIKLRSIDEEGSKSDLRNPDHKSRDVQNSDQSQ